jgi:hypothetical protein
MMESNFKGKSMMNKGRKETETLDSKRRRLEPYDRRQFLTSASSLEEHVQLSQGEQRGRGK